MKFIKWIGKTFEAKNKADAADFISDQSGSFWNSLACSSSPSVSNSILVTKKKLLTSNKGDAMDSIDCQIERVNGRIEVAKLYAQWWMVSAQTGVAKNRNMIWENCTPMTDDEKLKDALDTANNHIRSIEELVETKIKLMEQRKTH